VAAQGRVGGGLRLLRQARTSGAAKYWRVNLELRNGSNQTLSPDYWMREKTISKGENKLVDQDGQQSNFWNLSDGRDAKLTPQRCARKLRDFRRAGRLQQTCQAAAV